MKMEELKKVSDLATRRERLVKVQEAVCSYKVSEIRLRAPSWWINDEYLCEKVTKSLEAIIEKQISEIDDELCGYGIRD